MKHLCLALALCVLAAPAALAQSTTPPATPPAHPMANRPPPLTKDESDEVNKAYATALKSDSDLATQQADIKTKQKALQDEQKAYQQKLGEDLVKADPGLADIVKTHPNLRPSEPRPAKTPAAPKTPKPPKKTKAPAAGASTNAAPANPTPPAGN